MYSCSRDTLKSTSELELDIITDEELVKVVEELKKKVTLLRMENEVLEQSILRLQPSLMNGVNQVMEYAMKIQSGLGLPSKISKLGFTESVLSNLNLKSHSIKTDSLCRVTPKVPSSVRLTPSGRMVNMSKTANSIKISKTIIGGEGPKINVEGKLELVYTLMECQGKTLNKCKNNAVKQKAYLKAQFEEIDLRINEVDKLTENFNQQVVIDGWDPIGNRIPAEMWIRFLTEQAKKTDRQMDKLRIRVSTLNVRFRKLKADIKRKEHLRLDLSPVDFEIKLMEIRNNLDTIDLKHKQALRLKEVTGDANLSVTIHKKQMMAMEKYVDKLNKLTMQRKQQTIKLNTQRDFLQSQVHILEKRVDDIKKLRARYFVPNVLDYVGVKLRVSELNYSIQRLETGIKIQNYNVVVARREKKLISEMVINKSLLSETETSDTVSVQMSLKVTELKCNKGVGDKNTLVTTSIAQ